jgi:hypothetical protein
LYLLDPTKGLPMISTAVSTDMLRIHDGRLDLSKLYRGQEGLSAE